MTQDFDHDGGSLEPAVAGWAIADHIRTDLVTDALTMAITRRRPDPNVIFHSISEYLEACSRAS